MSRDNSDLICSSIGFLGLSFGSRTYSAINWEAKDRRAQLPDVICKPLPYDDIILRCYSSVHRRPCLRCLGTFIPLCFPVLYQGETRCGPALACRRPR